MNIVKKLGLRIFDIDAHSLRGDNFYKSILDYRKKILPKEKYRIKKDDDFTCILCGGINGLKCLEWEESYKLFECDNCGAVSPNINLLDKNKHISSIYDVKEYRKKFMRETHKQYDYRKNTFGRERFQYTVERLNLNKTTTTVLDLGCGAGYYIGVLDEENIAYKGLEVADHFVDYCQDYHGLNVKNTSLESEIDGAYNLITMFDVLEHLPDPINMLNLIHKKLKLGGYCVAYTPNIFSVGYELMGSKQNTLLPFEHLCFFDVNSLQYLADKTGFEIVTLETYGLDLMDYLLMKEFEDKINYTDSLGDMIKLLQSVLDKYEISNHFRITFRKKNHSGSM